MSSFATSEVLYIDKFVLLTKGEEGHISREKSEACFKELAVTRALPLTQKMRTSSFVSAADADE